MHYTVLLQGGDLIACVTVGVGPLELCYLTTASFSTLSAWEPLPHFLAAWCYVAVRVCVCVCVCVYYSLKSCG